MITLRNTKSATRFGLNLGTALLLCACASTGNKTEYGNYNGETAKTSAASQTETMPTDKEAANARLEQVAQEAEANQRQSKYSLTALEEAYKRDINDQVAALNYGIALSNAREYERAALVLGPFAKKADAAPVFKTEYAAVQLGLGNNEQAENFAQKAVMQDPSQIRAYHYLGIALDAEAKHKSAERAFRKALSGWRGDPVPVMNNLALNLASQGYLDESLELLKKAKVIAPDRIEIERNLRIVKALQESYSYQPYE